MQRIFPGRWSIKARDHPTFFMKLESCEPPPTLDRLKIETSLASFYHLYDGIFHKILSSLGFSRNGQKSHQCFDQLRFKSGRVSQFSLACFAHATWSLCHRLLLPAVLASSVRLHLHFPYLSTAIQCCLGRAQCYGWLSSS